MTKLHKACSAAIFVGIFIGILGFSAPASAQGTGQLRRDQMLQLAEIMGGVHYLRGECEGRSSQTWRKNMLKLIDLEQPSAQLRSQMIQRFNGNFKTQQKRFPRCGRTARQEAGRLAWQGQILTNQMANSLN